MKVLHMTKVQGIGGAEQHLLALLPALRERGVDARLLSLDAGDDAERFHQALDERGVPWRASRAASTSRPGWPARSCTAVRGERPDLLHTHMVHGDVYGSIAAHLLRCRSSRPGTTTTATCSGRSDTSTARSCSGVGGSIAISDAVRAFHIAPACPAAKLRDDPLRARRAARRAVGADARRRPASRRTRRSCSRSAA